MKRRVLWTHSALHELKQIGRYIAKDNPAAARKVAACIRSSGDKLGIRPIGRKGRVTGTFEKPVTGVPYILAYAIGPADDADDVIFILHVIHMARDWPADTWPSA